MPSSVMVSQVTLLYDVIFIYSVIQNPLYTHTHTRALGGACDLCLHRDLSRPVQTSFNARYGGLHEFV
jgi:hypothetical protein